MGSKRTHCIVDVCAVQFSVHITNKQRLLFWNRLCM